MSTASLIQDVKQLKAYFEAGSQQAAQLLQRLEGEVKKEEKNYALKADVIAKRRRTAIK